MTSSTSEARLRPNDPAVRTFAQLLVNVLLVSVTNFTVWFAITFFVYLETRSVFATGVLSGVFLVATALTGIWFGSIVDHHRKKAVMQASAAISAIFYGLCLTLYLMTPATEWANPGSPRLWLLICLLMAGVIVGNLRTIALPTVVTAMFDDARRDRANGLVGTATGISFLLTSVFSGLLVGAGGMLPVLVLALVVLAASMAHLRTVRLPDALGEAADAGDRKVDLRGTVKVVRGIPGMFPLIFFTTLNNLLGGALMALTDPYGLSMMSVQAWGIAWGALSALMIVGGLAIARTGLSSNPVRLVLLVNLALWTVTLVFPMRASVPLMLGGLAVYMFLIPFVEAAEQTVLQKVVPYERQGRVFGFAQSVEQSASPLTAFLISPVAQFVFMPLMTDGGAGARLLGDMIGTGPMRGVALLLMIAAVLGLVLTAFALNTKAYRLLSARYREPGAVTATPVPAPVPVADCA